MDIPNKSIFNIYTIPESPSYGFWVCVSVRQGAAEVPEQTSLRRQLLGRKRLSYSIVLVTLVASIVLEALAKLDNLIYCLVIILFSLQLLVRFIVIIKVNIIFVLQDLL